MAQTTDTTVHGATFYPTTDLDHGTLYMLEYYCEAYPKEGDTVTTARADVTCSECRKHLVGPDHGSVRAAKLWND